MSLGNGNDWQPQDPVDRVWNRATLNAGGEQPRAGDVALAGLLLAHGLAMNGGVLHAIEVLNQTEVDGAIAGYHYFGFHEAAELLAHVRAALDDTLSPSEEDQLEQQANQGYDALIPSDGTIHEAFQRRYVIQPGDFAPVVG
jgi:hypothetical protein